MSLSPQLLEVLVCPRCKGQLDYVQDGEDSLTCRTCALRYAVREDIPILLIDEARPL